MPMYGPPLAHIYDVISIFRVVGKYVYLDEQSAESLCRARRMTTRDIFNTSITTLAPTRVMLQ